MTGISQATSNGNQALQYGAAALGLGLTRALAQFVATLRFEQLPETVMHQAKRACVDWLGCALAGSQHRTIDQVISGMLALDESGEVPILGRTERFTRLSAALINGQAGHVLDFDDTHMGGVILHASSPILASLSAASYGMNITGREFLAAYVAGFEVAVRLGQAAPQHHAGGWHLTGTLGTVGAAAACARLKGLNEQQCAMALAIAATQAAGMQQNRGTSCKSFHAGKAASNGLLSAVLAAQGFSGSEEILEGNKGFIRIYSGTQDPQRLTDGLGLRWDLADNGYKPYACGVVLHPAIDAMIDLSRQTNANWQNVQNIVLSVNPDAIRITGVQQPGTGLMSKFSISHAASIAFIDQAGGLHQFSDQAPHRADVQALAERIQIQGQDLLARDQAQAQCTLHSGEVIEVHIAHATGTRSHPLSDEQLCQKFLGNLQANPRLQPWSDQLAQLWHLEACSDAAAVLLTPLGPTR
jgi:2-methylcitrate dehydratase PrpD